MNIHKTTMKGSAIANRGDNKVTIEQEIRDCVDTFVRDMRRLMRARAFELVEMAIENRAPRAAAPFGLRTTLKQLNTLSRALPALRARPKVRHCVVCGSTKHDRRTCPERLRATRPATKTC